MQRLASLVSGPGTADRLFLAALLTGVVAAFAACGSEAPEERLAEAREEMVELKGDVKQLESKVEEKRDAVKRAREALDEARGELDEAEAELARARARIDERATDVALFRAVQRALLENQGLQDYAIRAEVARGMVTLHGRVDRQAQADAALETARTVEGVGKVKSAIEVRAEGGGGGEGS